MPPKNKSDASLQRFDALFVAFFSLQNAVMILSQRFGNTSSEPAEILPENAVVILFGGFFPLFVAMTLLRVRAIFSGGSISSLLALPTDRNCIFRHFRNGFLTGILLLLPALLLSFLAVQTLQFFGIAPGKQEALKNILSPETPNLIRGTLLCVSVFFAPLSEELLYRGILDRVLWKKTALPPLLSAFLSSVFFAAVHLSLTAFLPLLFLALCLTAAARRFSLWSSLGIHIAFNIGNLLLAFGQSILFPAA